ncbi:MAG: hypothetical protein JSR63_12765 [Proteobacteria bacterium]|nr:hypothetical protein [Pseudomonadota bacterium]
MARGQPPLDIAVRLRNWLWYCLIKSLSGLSDDALDQAFAGSVGGGKRPRTFYRFRTLGSSPTDKRGYRKNGLSVYVAIHGEKNPERSSYEEARRAFESELWELLSEPKLSVARCREIVKTLMARRGLTRIDRDEVDVLKGLIDDPKVLIRLGLALPDEDMLEPFKLEADIDLIALLGALFKIALANVDLKRALVLQEAVEHAAARFLARWRAPEFLRDLLLHVLADRLFRNVWLDEQDWAIETGHKRVRSAEPSTDAQRRREVQDFVAWYISPGRRAGRRHPEDYGLPLIETPALKWTRQYRDALRAWRLAVQEHEIKARTIEERIHGNTWELERQALREARALKEAIGNHLMNQIRVFEGTNTEPPS